MIAHIRIRDQDRKEQSVVEHLENVSYYAGIFGAKVGLASCARIVGYIHDLGKMTMEFENYIKYSSEHEEDKRKGPDHSTAGAVWIVNFVSDDLSIMERLTAQILAMTIMGHHGGLPDVYDPLGESPYIRRLNKLKDDMEWKARYVEAVENFEKSISTDRIKKLFSDSVNEIETIYNTLKEIPADNKYKEYSFGVLCKILYSCLIDADRYDTATFMDGEQMLSPKDNHSLWSELSERLEKRVSEFPDKPNINKLRKSISSSCFENSKRNAGIYTLNCPTGSGKTFSSLRYALNHALKKNKARIFYIIPFISITDQNAAEIRKILSVKEEDEFLDDVILELHSAKENDENIDGTALRKAELVAERMDAPMILTTMVRFLNTFFADGTRNIRAAHNFANAVIIFDEIQTLDPKLIGMFNGVVNFLTSICNATVVLSTATQPILNVTPDGVESLKISENPELSGCTKEMFELFKRTEFVSMIAPEKNSKEFISRFVWENATRYGNALVVLNTKSSVRILYDEMKECYGEMMADEGFEVYVLTTNLCPEHRKTKIKEIRGKLDRKEKIIVISTQLIEAGVDISFQCVFRAMAGLDKIIQSAGRCNRHGENGDGMFGKIFLIKPDFEDLGSLQDIKRGKSATEKILTYFEGDEEKLSNELGSLKTIETYFRVYYQSQKDNMNYPFNDKANGKRPLSMYELLGSNRTLKHDAQIELEVRDKKRTILSQSFKTAARNFTAIDDYGKSILIPYGKGTKIINALMSAKKNSEISELLKKSQQYVVNISPGTVKELGNAVTYYENLGVYILARGYYDDIFGLSTRCVSNELLIFERGRDIETK